MQNLGAETQHHGNLRGPLYATHPQEIRPYEGTIDHGFPLIRPAISWGGGIAGGPLSSHDCKSRGYGFVGLLQESIGVYMFFICLVVIWEW